MTEEVKQVSPVEPLLNISRTFDAVNLSIFTGLSADPLFGPLAKALPAPPKVSQAVRQVTLPGIPPLPLPPGATAKETQPYSEQAEAKKPVPPGYSPYS